MMTYVLKRNNFFATVIVFRVALVFLATEVFAEVEESFYSLEQFKSLTQNVFDETVQLSTIEQSELLPDNALRRFNVTALNDSREKMFSQTKLLPDDAVWHLNVTRQKGNMSQVELSPDYVFRHLNVTASNDTGQNAVGQVELSPEYVFRRLNYTSFDHTRRKVNMSQAELVPNYVFRRFNATSDITNPVSFDAILKHDYTTGYFSDFNSSLGKNATFKKPVDLAVYLGMAIEDMLRTLNHSKRGDAVIEEHSTEKDYRLNISFRLPTTQPGRYNDTVEVVTEMVHLRENDSVKASNASEKRGIHETVFENVTQELSAYHKLKHGVTDDVASENAPQTRSNQNSTFDAGRLNSSNDFFENKSGLVVNENQETTSDGQNEFLVVTGDGQAVSLKTDTRNNYTELPSGSHRKPSTSNGTTVLNSEESFADNEIQRPEKETVYRTKAGLALAVETPVNPKKTQKTTSIVFDFVLEIAILAICFLICLFAVRLIVYVRRHIVGYFWKRFFYKKLPKREVPRQVHEQRTRRGYYQDFALD